METYLKYSDGRVEKRAYNEERINDQDFAKQFGATVITEAEFKEEEQSLLEKKAEASQKAYDEVLADDAQRKNAVRKTLELIPNVTDELIQSTLEAIFD